MRLQLVLAQLRCHNPPNKPKQNGKNQDRDTDHAVQPVRKRGRVSLPAGGTQERRHELERLPEEVKRRNRPPGLERPRGVGLGPAQVEEPRDDEEVDDGGRVALEVEDEVVGVAKGDGDDDNEGGDEVEEEAGRGGAKGPGGGPEAGEGDDAFFGELEVDAGLGEGDGEDVAKGGESDEDAIERKTNRSVYTECFRRGGTLPHGCFG